MLVKYTCSKFCSCKEGGGCSLAVTMFKPIVYKPPRGIPVIFTGPSPPVRAEDVDRTLRQQDSGVESALSYAKTWSKYTKELLAWVEKRLNVGEFCTGGGSRSFYTDVQKSAVRSCVTNHVFKVLHCILLWVVMLGIYANVFMYCIRYEHMFIEGLQINNSLH